MDMLWIGLVAVALLAVVVWRLRSRSAGNEDSGRSAEDLDTLTAWEPQATRILTTQERLAMGVLLRALPDHMILAQVPLARFIKVPTRHSYAEWLHRVGQLCADLVVCDSASQVIAVVDVRAPADKTNERAHKRQARMRRVLRAAGIPLHVWIENALPTPIAARDAIVPPKPIPVGSEPAPHAVAATAQQAKSMETPPLAQPQLLAESETDEVIEMREPPASTLFDNLDSGPVPLRRPSEKVPPR